MPGDYDTGTSTTNEKSQYTNSSTSPEFAEGSKKHSVRDAQNESIMDTVTSPTEILESMESKNSVAVPLSTTNKTLLCQLKKGCRDKTNAATNTY